MQKTKRKTLIAKAIENSKKRIIERKETVTEKELVLIVIEELKKLQNEIFEHEIEKYKNEKLTILE